MPLNKSSVRKSDNIDISFQSVVFSINVRATQPTKTELEANTHELDRSRQNEHILSSRVDVKIFC